MVYKPYFVVYRIDFSDDDKPLFIEYFESLYSLYEFIRVKKDDWCFYSVGRTLEMCQL